MSDEGYSPNRKPTPKPHYRPESSERPWEIRKDHITWSADSPFHSESYGWEAMILREGELVIGRLRGLGIVLEQYEVLFPDVAQCRR